jgi:hypothetical protein
MDKLLGAFIWLKQNLKQPGTMASITAVLAMVGMKVDAGVVQDWLNTLTLLFGTLGFFFQPAKQLAKVD